jgi:hypothetical protein
MKEKQEEKRYTHKEIEEMFRNDDTLSYDFRSEVLSRLDATYQAMYNCVHEREKTMHMADTWSDRWVDEHNRFVTLYQHYLSHPEHYVTLEYRDEMAAKPANETEEKN